MKKLLSNIKFNAKGLIVVLFVYIIAQFLWWEVLLVRQNSQLMDEKQKLLELSISSDQTLKSEIEVLHKEQFHKTIMIVGEGTIFLLLLLYGLNLIRKASKKERDLLDQKNNFLLSITHELKTPLATTKLQMQTLQKHQLPIEKQQELITVAINENERLNSLIDNVLLATRMQQNEYLINKEKTNVSEFITKIISTNYKTEIDLKNLKVDIAPELFLEVDRIAFPSIVTNLIDNAIKYSKEELNIEVKLFEKSNNLFLEISDGGIGINDSEKNEIFNQFYRSGNEEIRQTKGTGLGLFIVKYLVSKHNGSIMVKDNTPKGSVFKVKFPRHTS